MNVKSQAKEIKRALLQGGLVVTDRGTGKTTALAEILVEDPDSIVYATTMSVYSTLFQHLSNMGLDVKKYKDRILHLSQQNLLGRNNKNKYIDELKNLDDMVYVKAAVISLPFPVKVIKEDES